jgi:radical SAM protein with 4Fe4S-binding SPASM domain
LAAFARPIKVLRLYKDGEPLLNKRLADMIAYAKKSGRVESVDTSTNGALLTPERMAPVLEAGLDRINISVNGMNAEQYRSFTGVNFDFPAFVNNVKWLYANKGNCEIVMKIPDDVISENQRQEFLDTFGDHCDRIFIENAATCWPEFDVESHIGSKITKGMYGEQVSETDTCTYIFYSIAVNADGLVSACVMDWGRNLVIGDVKAQCLKDIWHSDAMNALRRQHLEGNRKDNRVCSRCGLLSYCLTDNIDGYRKELLPKFLDYAGDIKVPPPGTLT